MGASVIRQLPLYTARLRRLMPDRHAKFGASKVRFLIAVVGVMIGAGLLSRFLDPMFGLEPGTSLNGLMLFAFVWALAAGWRLVRTGHKAGTPEEVWADDLSGPGD